MKKQSHKGIISAGMFGLAGLILASCAAKENMTIKLQGNPSTGYTWNYEFSSPGIIEINEKSEYTGKDGVTGAPSNYTFTIVPKKEGSTTVTFSYARPWEDSEPEETAQYSSLVGKDLSVSITPLKSGGTE